MSTPTQKKHIRDTIPSYCKGSFANEVRIHYSQTRPFHYYNDLGHGSVVLDCSGYVGNVFWNAMHDTGIYIHDPLDERYTGYGYTGTLENYLRRHGKPVYEVNGYLVGDIVRWGTGRHAHTAVCYLPGSAGVSRWASHGRESGPAPVELNYRSDLVGVWRHPVLL